MNTPAHWSDPHPALRQLRGAFPHWGFLYNPFACQWLAIRAGHPTLSASTPDSLAQHLTRYQANPTLQPHSVDVDQHPQPIRARHPQA